MMSRSGKTGLIEKVKREGIDREVHERSECYRRSGKQSMIERVRKEVNDREGQERSQ